jgi:hypothetical protein
MGKVVATIAVGAAGFGLVLAACGGSGDDDGTKAGPSTTSATLAKRMG